MLVPPVTLLPWRRNLAVSLGEAVKGELLMVLGGERRAGLRPGREFRMYKSFLQDGGHRKFLKRGGIMPG